MNAIQALSLRKPDRVNYSSNMSEASSRYTNKKSNIRDILVRNFFRKYPLSASTDDL